MRLTAVVAAALAMAGCATYSEVQMRAPLIEFTSDRPQPDVVECISTILLDRYQVSTLPVTGGIRLVAKLGNDDQTTSTTTITDAGHGTRVEYRQMNGLTVLGWKKLHAQIRGCQ